MSKFVAIIVALCLLILSIAIAGAKPINTTDFGNLQKGMTKLEVLNRVGKPDLEENYILRRGRRDVFVTTWDYSGNRYVFPVRLIFHSGILVHKRKG